MTIERPMFPPPLAAVPTFGATIVPAGLPLIPYRGTARRLIADSREIPARYAMMVRGRCLDPVIKDGAKLAFSKRAKIEPNSLIAIWRTPEATSDDEPQAIIKRLIGPFPPFHLPYRRGPNTNLVPILCVAYLNPPMRAAIGYDTLLAVHACLGIVVDNDNDGSTQ